MTDLEERAQLRMTVLKGMIQLRMTVLKERTQFSTTVLIGSDSPDNYLITIGVTSDKESKVIIESFDFPIRQKCVQFFLGGSQRIEL